MLLTENNLKDLKKVKRFLLQEDKSIFECGVCFSEVSNEKSNVCQCFECFNYVCNICIIKMITKHNKYTCPFCKSEINISNIYWKNNNNLISIKLEDAKKLVKYL